MRIVFHAGSRSPAISRQVKLTTQGYRLLYGRAAVLRTIPAFGSNIPPYKPGRKYQNRYSGYRRKIDAGFSFR
jgi:hypothetical protein